MNTEITYEWTEPLGFSMAKASVERKTGKISHLLFLGIVMISVGIFFTTFKDDRETFGVMLFFAGILFSMWSLGLRSKCKKQTNEASKLLESKEITISFSDEEISQISESSSHHLKWTSFTDLSIHQDFIMLHCGEKIMMIIPLDSMTETQVNFIKSKLKT